MLIISWQWDLLGSKHLIIFPMSLSVKEMLDRVLSVKVSQLAGSTLVFVINEHWLGKNELKNSAFSLKSVMNLLSWKIGRMQGTFLSVKRVFKIDQSVFELELGTDTFWQFLRNILALKFQFNYSNFFEGK